MSQENKEKIKDLWLKGISFLDIANELGLSRNSVAGHIHRMRIKGEPLPIRREKKVVKLKKIKSIFDKKPPTGDLFFTKATNLFGLKMNSCRFIVKDGTPQETLYCNHKVWKQPYCEKHYKICYTPLKTNSQNRSNGKPLAQV